MKQKSYAYIHTHIQGVPEKSTFLKFQIYKSIWLFWTTLDSSKGLYWAIIWTVGTFHTILFVLWACNCHMDLGPKFEKGTIFWDTLSLWIIHCWWRYSIGWCWYRFFCFLSFVLLQWLISVLKMNIIALMMIIALCWWWPSIVLKMIINCAENDYHCAEDYHHCADDDHHIVLMMTINRVF